MKYQHLKICVLLSIYALAHFSSTAQVKLVPMPVKVTEIGGRFNINPATKIIIGSPELKKEAALFATYIKQQHNLTLKYANLLGGVNGRNIVTNSIYLVKKPKRNSPIDYYLINMDKLHITIEAPTNTGIFYGLQTLQQLITTENGKATSSLSIPLVTIEDYPRFHYRGMHLDVGRHYFPIPFIKKYIDYLAYHKLNNFHWHLTEDQGWRIEIKKYPKLTQVGSCRAQTLVGRYGSDRYDGKPYCGFYTQKQIKEIVQYATDRHINVIPEIEMPGHAMAALASYPYLGCTKGPYKTHETWGVIDDVFCAGNDSTFTFLENVLNEVLPLFPSKYIHIGGDECPKERWKKCPDCQKRIKDLNLKDEHGLQSYFIQRIEKFLNSKGRQIIGWDEILEGGLAPNATVMSWRGEEGGIEAAKQHHDVIMTPGGWCYFDHSQTRNEDSITIGGYTTVEKVYSYEPIPSGLNAAQEKYILGAQANLWTEYITNSKKAEYMLLPRLSALSEVLWTPKENKNWGDFEKRIPAIFDMYKKWGANYSKAYYEIQPKVTGDEKGVYWDLSTKNKGAKIVYRNSLNPAKIMKYSNPILVTQSIELSAMLTDEQGNALSNWVKQKFVINKAFGKKALLETMPSDRYAGFGPLTLVDGIQNTTGLVRNNEFLGYSGNDFIGIIDMESTQNISTISLHSFDQTGSWIHKPVEVSFYKSNDGINYDLIKTTNTFSGSRNIVYTVPVNLATRFIKVVAKNVGMIPEGSPGAGNKAWMFVDEIVVE